MGKMRTFYNWPKYAHITWHELPVTDPKHAHKIRSALHFWARTHNLTAATHHCPYFPNRILFRVGPNSQVQPYEAAPCTGLGAFCAGRRELCRCRCGNEHKKLPPKS